MNHLARYWNSLWVRWALCALLAAGYVCQGVANSQQLEITHTDIAIENLPAELEGLKVVQITDLHSTLYGQGQQDLLSLVRAERPDVIALTGDFVDGHQPNEENCVALAQGLAAIAPVYRIRGNHEYYQNGIVTDEFDKKMADAGVHLLENTAVELHRNGMPWLLAGMEDVQRLNGDLSRDRLWGAARDQYDYDVEKHFADLLHTSMPDGSYGLRVLLSHRPYYWQLWADMGFDLALCGHLHGLQVRVPGLGGAPLLVNRFFPQADSGLYQLDGIQVYISRGLAKQGGLRGLRINNRPELTVLSFLRR